MFTIYCFFYELYRPALISTSEYGNAQAYRCDICERVDRWCLAFLSVHDDEWRCEMADAVCRHAFATRQWGNTLECARGR